MTEDFGQLAGIALVIAAIVYACGSRSCESYYQSCIQYHSAAECDHLRTK